MAAVKAAMKTTPIAVIALLGAAVLVQLGCTKPVAEQPKIEQTKAEPTKAERIAAIDAILGAGPTGRPGDADDRAALRAERAQLAGSSPIRPMVTTAAVAPAKLQQTAQAPQIIVAHDSQATSDKEWESTKAAMDARSSSMQNLNRQRWPQDALRGESRAAFQRRINQQADQFVR
jgi:hypothetical protein